MIQFNGVVVLHPDTEIIHPSPDVQEEGCIPVLHGYTPTTPREAAQPYFESMDSFLSGSQFHSCKRETKKRTVLSTDHFAFVPVHLNLEFSLKETADTCHRTMSGTFRLYQNDQIICVACEPMTALFELLIEVIQKDIAQHWRKRTALRHSLCSPVQPSVDHHPATEVSSDKAKETFVLAPPGYPAHQDIVVHRIKEFLQIDVHSIAVSFTDIFQYLAHGLMCRTARSEPKTAFREVWIKHRSKNLGDRLLYNTIQDHGDSEFTGSAAVLRNLDSLDRSGLILPF